MIEVLTWWCVIYVIPCCIFGLIVAFNRGVVHRRMIRRLVLFLSGVWLLIVALEWLCDEYKDLIDKYV